MGPTTPSMPMAVSAANLSLGDHQLPDLSLGAKGGSKPLSLAPSAAPMPQGQLAPTMPAAPTSSAPPWDVQLQGDGSAVYQIPGPDGKPIVIGLAPPPRLPKALQKPQGAQ